MADPTTGMTRIDRVWLREFEDAFSLNPFEPRRWAQQAELLHDLGEAAGALKNELESAEGNEFPGAGERLAIAVVHAFSLAGRNYSQVIPKRYREQIGRTSCRAIGEAAARVHRELDKIRGRSAGITKVRMDAWQACFGEDLSSLLYFDKFIWRHNVLILGETGTGKELVASAIGQSTITSEDLGQSRTADPEEIEIRSKAVNVSLLSDELLQSELFGHVKGAFTGALSEKEGVLRGGARFTLFLDEIGDISPAAQAKLLRAMEEGKIRKLGGDEDIEVDVRYIGGTNRLNLEGDGKTTGSMRVDFYARMAGCLIRIPALRDRREDIHEIVYHYLQELRVGNEDVVLYEEPIREWFSCEEATSYKWPGNVRELLAVVRRLALGQDVDLMDIGRMTTLDKIMACRVDLETIRDWYTDRVLEVTPTQTAAAKILGLSQTALSKREKKRRNAQKEDHKGD